MNNIKSRFILAFILVAIIPTIFMSVFSYSLIRKITISNASELIEYQFNLIENFIRNTIKSASHELITLRESDIFKLYLGNRFLRVHDSLIRQYFIRIMKRHPEYLQLRYLDEKGKEVLRLDRKNGRLVWTPDSLLQDKSNYYYFQEIKKINDLNSVYVSKLDLNVEFNKIEKPYKLVARIGVVVKKNGFFNGCLLVNMDGNYFIENVMTKEKPCYSTAFLFNEDKLFITKNKNGIKVNFPKDIPKYFSHKIDNFLKDKEIILMPGEKGYFSVLPIRFDLGNGMVRYWWFMLFNSYDKVYAPLNESLKSIFIGLIAIFGFIVIFAYIMAIGLNRPIYEIVKYALNLTKYKKPKTEIRELDDISNAIEQMALNLEKSKREIESINEQLEEKVQEQVKEITKLVEGKLRSERKLREMHNQLVQADRLASLGLISTKLAHEIGNPLAAIKTALQVLKDDIVDETDKEYTDKIIAQVDKLSTFLKTFTSFASQKENVMKKVDVKKVINEITEFLSQQFGRDKIRLEVNIEQGLSFIGNELGFKHVIFNILLNSFQELESEGGTIFINASSLSEDTIKVEIYDSGKGVENIDKIFDPFYTTKQDGSGLGLAVVKDIIADNGWQMITKNKEGYGLSITLIIKSFKNGEVG